MAWVPIPGIPLRPLLFNLSSQGWQIALCRPGLWTERIGRSSMGAGQQKSTLHSVHVLCWLSVNRKRTQILLLYAFFFFPFKSCHTRVVSGLWSGWNLFYSFGEVWPVFAEPHCTLLKNGNINSFYLMGSFWRWALRHVPYLAQSWVLSVGKCLVGFK